MYRPALDNMVPALHRHIEKQWLRIADALAQAMLTEQQLIELTKVVVGSDYVVEQFISKPQLLMQLVQSGVFEAEQDAGSYGQTLGQLLHSIEQEADLEKQLRVFRQREMVRLIWRDLNRLADTRQTVNELSHLADVCVNQALHKLYQWMCLRWGTPYSIATEDAPSEPQFLVVLGMGKLGAAELNLSSDIDLMFCYPKNGETRGQKKSIDNQDFFIRLGKKLIRSLDAPTVDGFVFRVDMRLRPFGSVSPLACSFTAMENYYQQHGREWERYAMIKARVIAGACEQSLQLMQDLKPFVYRKYIDYSAFESLREMKAMITGEVRRKGLINNVKLGSGGIREIEFIAQVFQLIRGGRDTRLQARSLLKIFPLLPEAVGMPQSVVDQLICSYLFLRDVEHAIQAMGDRQTQELPIDELDQLRIACSLGFVSTEAFMQHLMAHRQVVSQHFGEILAPTAEDVEQQTDNLDWLLLWELKLSDEEALALCHEQQFEQPKKAAKLILDMASSKAVRLLQPIGVGRLKAVIPKLLTEVSTNPDNTQTLERVLHLVSAILRRSAYLVLLAENPYALKQLVRLCSSSRWFSDILTRQPVLLDELITPQTLYAPPQKMELDLELNRQMLRIAEDDEEQLMDGLRYFKHAHLLRVAASDVTGALAVMKVSDYLTWLAESILHRVLDIAWKALVDKHGVPCNQAGEEQERNFVVIGYGKMGGLELSYGSDLDLVFLHAGDSKGTTNGGRSIDNGVFYTRLGQRVIHILNTSTASGQLYEIDMRLRPAGNSGMLVSSVAAFESYQLNEAWTWEHQALVRARVISGSAELARQFEDVRHRVISRPRNASELLVSVSEMREKMRAHLGSSESQQALQFNLKQDRGGIVDIEFLVQYFCLAHGSRYPQIFTYTDNIRILDAIEKVGLIDSQDTQVLREAYKAYRAMGHRQAMQEKSTNVEAHQLITHRQKVSLLWTKYITDKLL